MAKNEWKTEAIVRKHFEAFRTKIILEEQSSDNPKIKKLLEKKLTDVTQDLVNRVGVDINSASASLLSYVAGVGAKVAHNIIAHREENGKFLIIRIL